MNIKKLVILLITIALGALTAPAQEGDGSVTVTDLFNQSVTISRFGTVLNLKNSNGKETVPKNIYRVCACGESGPCIESAIIPSKETRVQFEVFPKKGPLKKGETLVVIAAFRHGQLSVKRRISWEAGSSSVEFGEAIYASKPLFACTFEEKMQKISLRLEKKMCPRPPGGYERDWLICPPEAYPDALMVMLVSSNLNF